MLIMLRAVVVLQKIAAIADAGAAASAAAASAAAASAAAASAAVFLGRHTLSLVRLLLLDTGSAMSSPQTPLARTSNQVPGTFCHVISPQRSDVSKEMHCPHGIASCQRCSFSRLFSCGEFLKSVLGIEINEDL